VKITRKIADMSCNHCKMRIEKSLSSLKNIQHLKLDLERKLVEVDGNVSLKEVKNAITAAGYSPEVMVNADR